MNNYLDKSGYLDTYWVPLLTRGVVTGVAGVAVATTVFEDVKGQYYEIFQLNDDFLV